jgi:two-component sensor histidine kinase
MPPRVAGSTRLLEAPPSRLPEVPVAGLPVFDVAIRAEPSRVGHARRITSAWLKQRCGMADVRTALLLLVVSELCTNAIQHGRTEAFGLRGWMRSDGQVRLEVQDGSPSAIPSPQHVDPMEEGGRGLLLVEVLVRGDLGGSWGFNEDGTVAWCQVPVHAGHRTPSPIGAPDTSGEDR